MSDIPSAMLRQWPRVSVVIPAFNAAAHVAAAVESALNQTLVPHEVIAVDDGSSDCTSVILAGFGDRIRFIRRANGGPAAARNTGMHHATGELIAFVDADDTWAREHLATLVPLFNQPTVGLAFADVSLRSSRGTTIGSYWKDVRKVCCDGKVLEVGFSDILRNNVIPTSTVVARKSVVEEVGSFDESIPYGAEDWDLWLRISSRSRIVGVPVVLAHRLEHANNLSDQPAQAASVLAVLRKVEMAFPKLVAEAGLDLPGIIAQVLFEKGYRYFDKADFVQARRDFLDSLRLRFSRRAAGLYLATLLGVPLVTGLRRLKRMV